MPKLSMIEAQDLYKSSVAAQHRVGQLALDEVGNRYRYVKAGAVALIPGQLVQESAEDTNFRSMVCAASSAIGSKSISITLGGTAVTAGMFDGGYLAIESGTGLGQMFRIVSHTVQTSTTGLLVVTVDRPLETAIVVTTTQITIRKNPYMSVITSPVTTATGGVVGVAISKLTALYYGWIQSGGDVYALFDTSTNTSNGVGGIVPSLAVAGSVATAAEADVSPSYIGFTREVVSVDSTHGLIHLSID
jgi:hypothetical protein